MTELKGRYVECKRILPKWKELYAYNKELKRYLQKNIDKYSGMVKHFKKQGPNQSQEYKKDKKNHRMASR